MATTIALANPALATHPQAELGTGGGVSSAAPAATAAGLEILRIGGNAADAAVATALALAVVHPQAGNLGGGGLAVIRFGDTIAALDFRETAPAASHRDMYLDQDGKPVLESSLVGPLAAGVPGSPAGLHELHREHGALPWARVVAPAVNLADQGFVITERLAASLESNRDHLARFPETSAVWLPGDQAPRAGQLMRLPALASTLRAYAQVGPEAITSGPMAAAIEASARLHGGVLTAADLQTYRPVWRPPVRFSAFGYQVASIPLPSSGGIILGQTCGLLERLGWPTRPRFGADRAHLLAEAWRRAFADRYLLGDPLTTGADQSQLLAGPWLDHRAQTISPDQATPSSQVQPWDAEPATEHLETTHLSVIDGAGNVVSLTTTLNGSYGCGLLVPGAGFLLNNEMDDFAVAPGVANQFGLIQGEANAVGPGKRMLSSMTPTVAFNDDDTIALGSPGGSRIPTATAQVLLNLIVDHDHLQAAVNRPRIHHQWRPDVIAAEPDALAPETAEALRSRGHELHVVDRLGEVCAVRRSADGAVEAAADPRGPGAAGVVRPKP